MSGLLSRQIREGQNVYRRKNEVIAQYSLYVEQTQCNSNDDDDVLCKSFINKF